MVYQVYFPECFQECFRECLRECFQECLQECFQERFQECFQTSMSSLCDRTIPWQCWTTMQLGAWNVGEGSTNTWSTALPMLGIFQVSARPTRRRRLPEFSNVSAVYLRISIQLQMDRANKALAERLSMSIPRSFRAIADHAGISAPPSTSVQRGRRFIKAEAESQQQIYLTPFEGQVVVDVVLQLPDSDFIRIDRYQRTGMISCRCRLKRGYGVILHRRTISSASTKERANTP